MKFFEFFWIPWQQWVVDFQWANKRVNWLKQGFKHVSKLRMLGNVDTIIDKNKSHKMGTAVDKILLYLQKEPSWISKCYWIIKHTVTKFMDKKFSVTWKICLHKLKRKKLRNCFEKMRKIKKLWLLLATQTSNGTKKQICALKMNYNRNCNIHYENTKYFSRKLLITLSIHIIHTLLAINASYIAIWYS